MRSRALLTAGAVVILAHVAQAKVWTTLVPLTPLDAGVTSGAVGLSSVSVDDVNNIVNVTTTIYGTLSSSITNSHFHFGIYGVAFSNVGLAVLTGVQTGVLSTASGFGSIVINDAAKTVTANLNVANVVNATMAHIHGPAFPGSINDPVCILASSATVAPFSAPAVSFSCGNYSDHHLMLMRAGQMYFNIHTLQNAAGELRGQIIFPSQLDPNFVAVANIAQTVPAFQPGSSPAPVYSAGTGAAIILRPAGVPIAPGGSTMFVGFGAVTGLNGTQTNAHLHGLPSKSVYVGLPPSTGSFSYAPMYLNMTQTIDLMSNKTYVNVHTNVGPGGEIAGAVTVPTALGPLSCPRGQGDLVAALSSQGLSVLPQAMGVTNTTRDILNARAAAYGGGVNSLTVFAPTDAAFLNLLATLNTTAASLAANSTLVDLLLGYHVLGSYVPAPSGTLVNLLGTNFTVSSSGVITSAGGNTARITTPNAVNNAACQVTVHIIDAVLLPIAFGAPLPPALPKSGAATFFSLMPTAVIGAALLLVAGFF